jgi:hypothetical protein
MTHSVATGEDRLSQPSQERFCTFNINSVFKNYSNLVRALALLA